MTVAREEKDCLAEQCQTYSVTASLWYWDSYWGQAGTGERAPIGRGSVGLPQILSPNDDYFWINLHL